MRILQKSTAVAAAFAGMIELTSARPLDEVERFLAEGDYKAAIQILEPMVSQNPYNGLQAYYLGAALARSGHCEKAVPHLQNSLKIGVNGDWDGLRSANFRLAECAAEREDYEQSATYLHKAWARYWAQGLDVDRLPNEEIFAPLRKGGFLRPITGRTPEADAGRIEARQRADLDYFDRLIREGHPDPFHKMTEEAWRNAVVSLDARLPLEAKKFDFSLKRLASMVGDGHTTVFPQTQGHDAWKLLPVFIQRFSDGWVITAAAPSHVDLVGARLDSIEGRPISEIVRHARAVLPADNELTHLWLAGVLMQTYDFYVNAGAAGRNEVIFDLTLPNDTRRTVKVPAGPITRNPNSRGAPADWHAIGRDTLWLSDPNTPFFTHWFPDEQALYVQVNQVNDGPDQTLAKFGKDVFKELSTRQARSIIFDLRNNNGGNTTFTYDFLRAIDRYEALERDGSVIALIGPRSYSATMDVIGRLQNDMDAVLVGWPTGGRPNIYSTERPFTLPYSRISGSISVRWHQHGVSGNDIRPWFPPDIAVWPSRMDILAGRDPVLEKALELAAE